MSLFPPASRPARRQPALRKTLLVLAIAASCGSSGAAPDRPTLDSVAARHYEIPAGPLGRSLALFAAQSGLGLSFEPALAEGLRSPALSGSLSARMAAELLLAGSELELVALSDGSYTLRRRPPSAAAGAQAPGAAAPSTPLPVLPLVRTRAGALDEHGGVSHIGERTLRRFPAVNGDVTSVLKLHPQLQFDNAQLSALTQGEIAAADISINGAKYYQNLFLLDGVSLNNDLDPVASNAAAVADVPGTSQGMPVDKDLLCSVEVHDSNVSARYGEFQGGVVRAELCEARRSLSGRVSYSLARSEWSTLFVDPQEEEDLRNSTSAARQPRWSKQTLRATLQGRPSDTLGITAYLTQTRSLIPLRGYAASQTPADPSLAEQDQTRRKTDGLVKLDWRPRRDLHAWATLRHEPMRDQYFLQNGRGTDFTVRGGGESLSGGLAHDWAGQQLRHELSYQRMENSRRSALPYFKFWYWSADKNWGDPTKGSAEGSWGDVDTVQRTLAYSLDSRLQRALPLAGAEHRLSWGLSLRQREAHYERLRDHYSYGANNRALTRNCTDANGVVDTEACSLAPTLANPGQGQYFAKRDVFQAGRLALTAAQFGAWVEDQARWQGLSLRLGLRADRDELASRPTLAPRLAGSWTPLEAWPLQLQFGLNRYYGRSFFNAALREKRQTLQYAQSRGKDLLWHDGAREKPQNRLEDLRSPYDDERMLGAAYQARDWSLALKWVHRESRDQLTRTRPKDSSGQYAGVGPYVYTNQGRGSADNWSVELNGARALAWAGGYHRWNLSLSRSQQRSNHADYEALLPADGSDPWIKYKGQFIRLSDKPADNYNRPWTARASLSTEWPAAHLSLYQFARWQGGYRKVASTNKSEPFDGGLATIYAETDFKPSFAWDMSLSWQPRFGRHRPFVTLSVENLTNRRNVITGAGDTMTYEKGRSASLQVGYEF